MVVREGNLEAPTRHPIEWKSEEFWDKNSLNNELERVYDICHGCRRCVSLCNAFPTLFDLIDESETMEMDGVAKADYTKVVDQCYLCDMCYMSKCPYVPPHDWNVDFPHLMLRAKAQKFKEQGASFRDKSITSTDTLAKLITIPVVQETANAVIKNRTFRKTFETAFGIHKDAVLPEYSRKSLRRQWEAADEGLNVSPAGVTTGKVALYATCYGNYNSPNLGEDFRKVYRHNDIVIDLVEKEVCCGMPKLELGDLDGVEKLKDKNIPVLAKMVDEGYDLIAPIPSCVLMYKQELPLMFPDDPDVKKVQAAFYDPFEYLFLRHKQGLLNTEFKSSLGDVSYQVACHLRVQNIGLKTRDILALVPDTTVHAIERCSGHDGTYAMKKETHDKAVKIARPVTRKMDQHDADYFSSDCPMAAEHLTELSQSVEKSTHPMTLLRIAYGI